MNTLTLATGLRARSFWTYARVLATQILYLAPVFWLLELTQNQLFRLVQGEWGWVYPASPYGWFSFGSLTLWAGAIFLLWTLHYYWFYPKKVSVWRRVLIGAAFTWTGGVAGRLPGGQGLRQPAAGVARLAAGVRELRRHLLLGEQRLSSTTCSP